MDLALSGSIEPFYHETGFPITFMGAGCLEGPPQLPKEASFMPRVEFLASADTLFSQRLSKAAVSAPIASLYI